VAAAATSPVTDRSFFLKGSGSRGVLLIHGLAGAPGEMRFLAKRLHAQGFTVHVPQIAGHGAGVRELLRTGWRDWLASMRTALAVLAAEVDEVYVAGICAGGALGLALAAEHPEIKAVAVYSMTFEYDGWSMPRWSAAAPLIQLFADLPLLRLIRIAEPYPYGIKDERLRRRVSEAPEKFIAGSINSLPFGSLCQMYRLGRHISLVGPGILTPVLILHAQEDDMSAPRNAWRLRDVLGGPATVHILQDSYHMIHVDRERDLVAKMTGEFFGGPVAANLLHQIEHAHA
jgi:carboxylesterase